MLKLDLRSLKMIRICLLLLLHLALAVDIDGRVGVQVEDEIVLGVRGGFGVHTIRPDCLTAHFNGHFSDNLSIFVELMLNIVQNLALGASRLAHRRRALRRRRGSISHDRWAWPEHHPSRLRIDLTNLHHSEILLRLLLRLLLRPEMTLHPKLGGLAWLSGRGRTQNQNLLVGTRRPLNSNHFLMLWLRLLLLLLVVMHHVDVLHLALILLLLLLLGVHLMTRLLLLIVLLLRWLWVSISLLLLHYHL